MAQSDTVGLIGCGALGATLAQAWLQRDDARAVLVSERTLARTTELRSRYPSMRVESAARVIAREAGVLVLSVLPAQIEAVLRDIEQDLSPDTIIVSTAASVSLERMERIVRSPVSRVLPCLTGPTTRGAALLCHGRGIGPGQARRVEQLFAPFFDLTPVREPDFSVATVLSGCAPALVAYIGEQIVRHAGEHSTLSPDTAWQLLLGSVEGAARDLRHGNITPGAMIARIQTPGGITAALIDVLRDRLPALLDAIFDASSKRDR